MRKKGGPLMLRLFGKRGRELAEMDEVVNTLVDMEMDEGEGYLYRLWQDDPAFVSKFLYNLNVTDITDACKMFCIPAPAIAW